MADSSREVQVPRRKICILSLSPIHQDARVLRQIEYAAKEYDVTVVGWGELDRPRPHVRMKPVQRWVFPPLQRSLQVLLMFGARYAPTLWQRWYWRKPDHRQALELLLEESFDLIHANSALALPVALQAAACSGARVLFDAHEYSPEQASDRLWGRLLVRPFYTKLIRDYAPQADAMITVAPAIAKRYRQEFDLRPSVVMNVPFYSEHPHRPVDPEHVRLIHHGAAMHDRYLEKLIEVLNHLERRFELHLMLVERDRGYIERLEKMARRLRSRRVTFRSPVPPAEVVRTINHYDIGIHLIPPVNFNNLNALPNKFFDFMMAGLAIAIGPSPEMARIVRQHQLGVVSDSFDPADVANFLNALSPQDINRMKQNSLEAGRVFNAGVEMEKMLAIYQRLLS
jgi:glycosyltransferase involved in cell wall biosynthesis